MWQDQRLQAVLAQPVPEWVESAKTLNAHFTQKKDATQRLNDEKTRDGFAGLPDAAHRAGRATAPGRFSSMQAQACSVVTVATQTRRQRPTRSGPTEESRFNAARATGSP